MYSSPMVDVGCLLTNCLKPKVRQKYLEQILDAYHDELNKYLGMYGYKDVFSREQVWTDYKASIGQGFYWALANAWVSQLDNSI